MSNSLSLTVQFVVLPLSECDCPNCPRKSRFPNDLLITSSLLFSDDYISFNGFCSMSPSLSYPTSNIDMTVTDCSACHHNLHSKTTELQIYLHFIHPWKAQSSTCLSYSNSSLPSGQMATAQAPFAYNISSTHKLILLQVLRTQGQQSQPFCSTAHTFGNFCHPIFRYFRRSASRPPLLPLFLSALVSWN